MPSFYFDNYNVIQADGYEGRAIFVDDNTEMKIMFFNDTCKLAYNIKLRNRYYIKLDDKVYPIEYRFITHTERFENENCYDGRLGFFYDKKGTDFYLWAPTAYGVTLSLTDGRKIPMTFTEKGVFYLRVDGDCDGVGYSYLIEHTDIVEATDPYAISSTVNSAYNFVIDPQKLPKSQPGKNIAQKRDAIVYETNVRDFTSDRSIPFSNPGKFAGMTQRNIVDAQGNKVGFDYLIELGITHVQLMPVYDYGSIDERDCSVGYNWGYDPVQYNIPEGKYSSDPCDPYKRIAELIELVNTFHHEDIGVIMDVVYNHVFDDKSFSFAKIVPYYYFRYHRGNLSDASFCGNETASERYMVRRFIVDSICYLTKTFGFDGYRFDLMGIHDIETMNIIHDRLSALNPNIYLFGEGWTMPTAIATELCATQKNFAKINDYGFFNDDFRNTTKQLVIGHISYDINNVVRRLLQGIDYENPANSLQYISCHDDFTIYDQLYYDFESDRIIDRIKLGFVFVFLGQGNAFLHSGCEAGRTKYGVKNSFRSSEAINRLDWSLYSTNKDLVDFVRELIQIRKLPEFYLGKTGEDIIKNTNITTTDGIVKYTLDRLTIYINLTEKPTNININGQLLSHDGVAINRCCNEEMLVKTYLVVAQDKI